MPLVPVVDVQQGLSEPTGKASVSSSLRLLAVLALLMPTGVLTGVAEHRDSEWYLLQSFKKNIVQHGIRMHAYI